MGKRLLRSGAATLASFVVFYVGLVIAYLLLFMLIAMFGRQAIEPVPIVVTAAPLALVGSLVVGILYFFWTSDTDAPISLLRDDTEQINTDQNPTIKG